MPEWSDYDEQLIQQAVADKEEEITDEQAEAIMRDLDAMRDTRKHSEQYARYDAHIDGLRKWVRNLEECNARQRRIISTLLGMVVGLTFAYGVALWRVTR